MPYSGVEYSWKGLQTALTYRRHQVTGFPKETKSFSVRMSDLNDSMVTHGGGTILNDGSGMIPSGHLMTIGSLLQAVRIDSSTSSRPWMKRNVIGKGRPFRFSLERGRQERSSGIREQVEEVDRGV